MMIKILLFLPLQTDKSSFLPEVLKYIDDQLDMS